MILKQYLEVNEGKSQFVKTVNWYIPNHRFDELKQGIEGIENQMLILFPENQKVMKIMNETLQKIHLQKQAEKKTK